MLQTEHSPWNFLAHFFDFSLGGGFLGMRNRARIGWRSHRGGWDSAISRAVIPKDHRSLRLSYVASGFSSHAITSGAIQYGVPMNVFRRPIVRSNCALTPKSTDKGNQQLINKAKNWRQNHPLNITGITYDATQMVLGSCYWASISALHSTIEKKIQQQCIMWTDLENFKRSWILALHARK